ncbi:uncharacterized protein LOC126965083 [Leptidea sinapis]|uniref:BDBT FKBP like N-terminal domain-containing protein n=1 Tax=Leptidea sinapis TaxID=189913 RepID=A0A5E4QU09_9NEOP|nr:uncharacterized protein LOC126965083 [Leptidea sinapis]VVD01465.1 unnamed protein product [Leptidea sinapis]
MFKESVVSLRPDREIRKTIELPGDYNLVPYEDSRCKISLTDVVCVDNNGQCEIENESIIFNSSFNGNVVIGDVDSFIDKDFELILQQMCCGEICTAVIIYRNKNNELVKQISCKIHLKDVMEEQLIGDWGWCRLYETAEHHKDKGVQLVKDKRVVDAFRRFSKALKMIVAIEPIDPETIEEEKVKEIINLRVKVYNNLAYCQLHFNEYEAALDLCNRAIKYDPDSVKALYRRCISYAGLGMFEEAWADIKHALSVDPSDKALQAKAKELSPTIEKINKNYENICKKMFN